MFVHSHQSGDYGCASKVDGLRAGWLGCAGGKACRGNLAMIDDDGLILARRRSGSVDHANVLESDHGGVHRDEGLDARDEAALGGEGDCQKRTTRKLGFHVTDYLKDWRQNPNTCVGRPPPTVTPTLLLSSSHVSLQWR